MSCVSKAAELEALSRDLKVDEMSPPLVLCPLRLSPSGKCLVCASKSGHIFLKLTKN